MRLALTLVLGLGMLTSANAQWGGGSGVTPDQMNSALAAVTASIPQPTVIVPAQPLGTGSTGTAGFYTPPDASPRLVFQGTNVVTDSSGNWTVSWATSYVSSSPLVLAKAVVSSTFNTITCEVSARSSSTASGWCRQATPTLLNLSIVTTGLTLNPFANLPATGTAVMVFSREPTQ